MNWNHIAQGKWNVRLYKNDDEILGSEKAENVEFSQGKSATSV